MASVRKVKKELTKMLNRKTKLMTSDNYSFFGSPGFKNIGNTYKGFRIYESFMIKKGMIYLAPNIYSFSYGRR
jgi:hypothetical protein